LTSSQHDLGVARKESDKNKDEMNAEKTKNE
jgi:hypothetical protein